MIKKGVQNEGLAESEIGETTISILGWDVEIPHGAEMHVAAVNKVHRNRNSGK